MNIYEIDAPLGDVLIEVQSFLVKAICHLEEIPEEDWSGHMDALHRKLRALINEMDYVGLKGED